MRYLFLFLATLCSAISVSAQEDSGATAEPKASRIAYPSGSNTSAPESQALQDIANDGSLSIGLFINAMGIVVIVGVLGVAAYFFIRRGMLRKPFSKSEGKLRIKESRMLGNRQFIMVVEYEENKILLGVGPGKIDYLTSLNTYRNDFPQVEEENAKIFHESV